MSRVRCRLTLSLVLESPFLSRGLAAAGLGIDMAQARDDLGWVILPAEMILGNLRQAWVELGLDLELFGCKSKDEAGSNTPERGNIILTDLVAQTEEKGGTTTRVEIDEETGSVKPGHLAVVELPYPMGQEVTFTGTVLLWLEEAKVKSTIVDLTRALELIPAVGAMKSAGFGWIVGRGLHLEETTPLARPSPHGLKGGRAVLSLTFDRPLLVDAQRLAGNVYRGSAVVPGAVLKGALARRLERAGVDKELGDDLSRVVFGHAFPVDVAGGLSHLPLPLSLTTDREGAKIIDLLLDDGRLDANFSFGPTKEKVESRVRAALGKPMRKMTFDTRTRTAVQDDTGSPESGKLFSYGAVITRGLEWRMELDQGKASDDGFRRLLGALAEGLDGIGKTGASATIRIDEAALPPAPSLAGHDGIWALVLRTPATLNDVAALRDGRELEEDYRLYWQGLGLTMTRFFARQRLAGGYQGMRFRRDHSVYEPFLLTEPGSVFVLSGDAGGRLASLVRSNLPLRDAGLDWKTCPFVPENGFGAFDLIAEARHV